MMFILTAWIGILSWTGVAGKPPHAIYVSVIEIEQNSVDSNGIIRIKVFMNDLQDAIFNQTAKHVDLANDSCDKNKVLVSGYFKDHLIIMINGLQLSYNYQSCEINDISIWFEFTFSAVNQWRTLAITADYLIELFPTQSNIVSIAYEEQKSMFRLTKGETQKTVSFD